jgi:hypothetical protein
VLGLVDDGVGVIVVFVGLLWALFALPRLLG